MENKINKRIHKNQNTISSFMRRKFILSVIGSILVIAIGFWFFTSRTEKYSVARVERGDLTQVVSASGQTQSQNQVDLKFQTSGLLTWVGVKEGDYVYQDQAIASLDKQEVEKKLLKALRDYSKVRWDFEEAKEVTYKDKIITDTIKRILEKNQFDLDKAVADVEIVDIALRLSTLNTPISGIVTHVETAVAGVNITSTTPLFTIVDPQAIVFRANIDEVDISRVSLGKKAKITLDAYPHEEFLGEVRKIGFAAVSTPGGGTAFPVEVSLPSNENLKFRVGMNGDIEIVTQEKRDILLIPSSAIFTKEEKNYAWRLAKGQAKKTEVGIGLADEKNTEILTGLNEGDEIVTGDISKLKEGQKIRND